MVNILTLGPVAIAFQFSAERRIPIGADSAYLGMEESVKAEVVPYDLAVSVLIRITISCPHLVPWQLVYKWDHETQVKDNHNHCSISRLDRMAGQRAKSHHTETSLSVVYVGLMMWFMLADMYQCICAYCDTVSRRT